MPLCFPEKITSGPADMGVMGAEVIGVNGVPKAGGTIPEGRYNGIILYFVRHVKAVKWGGFEPSNFVKIPNLVLENSSLAQQCWDLSWPKGTSSVPLHHIWKK